MHETKCCYLRREVEPLTQRLTHEINLAYLHGFSDTLQRRYFSKNVARILAAIITAQKCSKRRAALSQTRTTNTHLLAKHPQSAL